MGIQTLVLAAVSSVRVALVVVVVASNGPVRRRSTTEATAGADRPTTVGGTDP